MSDEQMIINITDKPNSFEMGKEGQRFKIYYDKPEDLVKHILKLMSMNFIDADTVEALQLNNLKGGQS